MKTAMQELIDKIILESNSDKPTEQQKYILIWVKYMADDLLEKEKEQIIDAYEDGKQNGMDSITNIHMYIIGEKYYNQTYNQNK
jgi:hypothetical protein